MGTGRELALGFARKMWGSGQGLGYSVPNAAVRGVSATASLMGNPEAGAILALFLLVDDALRRDSGPWTFELRSREFQYVPVLVITRQACWLVLCGCHGDTASMAMFFFVIRVFESVPTSEATLAIRLYWVRWYCCFASDAKAILRFLNVCQISSRFWTLGNLVRWVDRGHRFSNLFAHPHNPP